MISFKVNCLGCCQKTNQIHSPNTAYISESWFPNKGDQLANVNITLSDKTGPAPHFQSEILFVSSVDVHSPDSIEISPFFLTNLLPDSTAIPPSFIVEVLHCDLFANQQRTTIIGTSEESSFSIIRSIDYPFDYDYTDSFREFFTDPILLAVDQTVCVPISVLDRVLLQQSQSVSCDQSRTQFLFIKILSAKVSSLYHESLFYIDSDNTQLIQRRVIDSVIYNPKFLSPVDFTSTVDTVIAFLTFYMKLLAQTDNNLSGNSLSRPFLHLKGPPGSGKTMTVQSVAKRFGFNFYFVNCHELCATTTAAVEEKIKNALNHCRTFSPLIVYLKNLDLLLLKEKDQSDERLIQSFSKSITDLLTERSDNERSFVLVASTETDLPFCLRKLVTREIDHPYFHTEQERSQLIETILNENCIVSPHIHLSDNNAMHYLVRSTEAFIKSDVELLIKRIFELSRNGDLESTITEQTIDEVLSKFHEFQGNAPGMQSIPKVNWKDIGGLSDVIEEIIQITKLAIKGNSMLPNHLKVQRNNGILLYGPPGTGKTLLAKGVATECSINFISVKGPELVNMYVGKSEENVRQLFQHAVQIAPCVLFFDELDSLAPRRGISGDSGGVMDRVVSQLATEMDAVKYQCQCSGLVLIGATNRPDLIDPALIRPGRFDQMFYIGGYYGREAKLDVLTSITRRFPFDQRGASSSKAFIDSLIDYLPEKITGADLYAICANALQKAFHRIIASDPDIADSQRLLITTHDFESSVSSIELSVSHSEFRKYEDLKDYYAPS